MLSSRARKILLWAGVLGVISAGAFGLSRFFRSAPPPAPAPSATAPAKPLPPEPVLTVVEGRIGSKGSLARGLAEKGLPREWVDLITSALRSHVNFRKVKEGTFRCYRDEAGGLVRFIFEAGPEDVYEVERTATGYGGRRMEVRLDPRLVRVAGEIRSSLFEAMEAAGEGDALALAFAEILAWEIDFHKDLNAGDRFTIVVEKLYKESQFVRYGAIHALEYRQGDRAVRGFRYGNEYYRDNGLSLRRAFLKSPLRFNRISSRFSRARRHPILGGLRPHYGVDYAAPAGAPVWAVADGVVVAAGWNGGFGRQVVLRHMNGYVTYYGHLSRLGAGIHRGKRIRQKQIIGYVGSTGLSTGPHLDYRLAKDGQFRNPLRETFPSGVPVEKAETARFHARRDEMAGWLEGKPLPQKASGGA
jgi:murein DD-endopeptidase MepM/ murein hydrolase activator NlpD